MKSLQDYINTVSKEYQYRLKFVYEPDLEILGRILERYELIEVVDTFKSPMQFNPLDFTNVDVGEVYIMDVKTARPMSDEGLRWEISRKMSMPVDYIVVRNENNPYNELEARIVDRHENAYVVKLTDPEYDSDGIDVDTNFYKVSEEDLEDLKSESPWEQAKEKLKKMGL